MKNTKTNKYLPVKETWEKPQLALNPIIDDTLGNGVAGTDFGSEMS